MRALRLASRLALAGLLVVAGCGARRPRKAAEVPRRAKAVIRTAKSYLPEEGSRRGTPRDCSDFVAKVFAENGLQLPRTSEEMSLFGERVRSSKELRMGDLVFFSGERVSRIVGHAGIYVNNGIFIHLTKPSTGVRMESLYSDYYRKRYLTGRRLLR